MKFARKCGVGWGTDWCAQYGYWQTPPRKRLKRPHGTNDSAPGLGTDFFEAFEAAVELFEAGHISFSLYPGKAGAAGAKRVILKRFPYDIVIVEYAAECVLPTN